MGLTQVSKDGVKNDAITKTKIPANQIEASELADNAVDTNAIADQAVTLDKLPHGDANNDGKFLRANNGADPSFETVSIPASVGGANGVDFNDNVKARFGTNNDLEIKHDGSDSLIKDTGTGSLVLTSNDVQILNAAQNEYMIRATENAAVQLFHNNLLRCQTTNVGLDVVADGSATELKIKTDGGTLRGYIYANNANQIGLLDQGGDWAIQHQNDSHTDFYIQTNKKLRIDADGLKFGTDTAAANALDDFETGTWTPTQGNFNTFSLSSGQFVATYTKIGNIVHFSFEQTGGELAWAQAQYIGGLPFTVNKNGVGSWTNNYPNSGGEMLIWGANYLYFAQTDGYNTSALKLVFSGTYETNQ